MSYIGIQKISKIFSDMQTVKHELLNIGSKDAGTKSGQQDIRLAHLLTKMNDAVKNEFNKITTEDI